MTKRYVKHAATQRYISKKALKKRVREIAKAISLNHKNGLNLVVICVLKGANAFFSDLIKEMSAKHMIVDYIQVSSYTGRNSIGKVLLKKDIEVSVFKKDVIIVEDIIDSGLTVNFLKHHIQKKSPKSIDVCALLERKGNPSVAKYTGFFIDTSAFVLGYGLDYNQKYRQLNNIRCFK